MFHTCCHCELIQYKNKLNILSNIGLFTILKCWENCNSSTLQTLAKCGRILGISWTKTLNKVCCKCYYKNPTVTSIKLLLDWYIYNGHVAISHQTFNLFFNFLFNNIMHVRDCHIDWQCLFYIQ